MPTPDNGVELDTRHWPVLVTRVFNVHTPEPIQQHFARVGEIVRERNEPYAMIVDLRRVAGLSASQRAVVIRGVRDQEQTGELSTVTALVFASGFVRSVLTAFLWVKKPSRPLIACKTFEEALARCQEHLACRRAEAADGAE